MQQVSDGMKAIVGQKLQLQQQLQSHVAHAVSLSQSQVR
jgi:hypothetical protein